MPSCEPLLKSIEQRRWSLRPTHRWSRWGWRCRDRRKPAFKRCRFCAGGPNGKTARGDAGHPVRSNDAPAVVLLPATRSRLGKGAGVQNAWEKRGAGRQLPAMRSARTARHWTWKARPWCAHDGRWSGWPSRHRFGCRCSASVIEGPPPPPPGRVWQTGRRFVAAAAVDGLELKVALVPPVAAGDKGAGEQHHAFAGTHVVKPPSVLDAAIERWQVVVRTKIFLGNVGWFWRRWW